MGELVIYENDMNKLKFGNFTKVSMNFFMSLCYFMKNRGTTHFTISFDDLKEKSGYTQTEKKDFIKDLDHMTDQMLKVNSKVIEKKSNGKKRIYKFDLFPTFIIDEESETLEVAVNENFTWLLNEFNHYTSIDLEEIVGFKSKYTKNLFRLIRQWKSRGELRISGEQSIKEFKEKIGIKDTYSNAEMNRRCLTPSVQEINDSNCSIKNLSYSLEYANRRGRPISAIQFTWNKVENEYRKITDNTADSLYFTIREALKDNDELAEDDFRSIFHAAKKNGIKDKQAKQRIEYALKQTNIRNLTGYIIALMQQYNSPVEIRKRVEGLYMRGDYDIKELERLLVANNPSSHKTEKLTDIVDFEESSADNLNTGKEIEEERMLKELQKKLKSI